MKLNEQTIGPTTINNAGAYVLIGTYSPQGGELFVEGKVGAGGALNGLKITVSPITTGPPPVPANHVSIFKADGDFASADSTNPFIGGSGLPGTPIYQTAANGNFAMRLRLPAREVAFWAKKATADTTVTLNICEKIESPPT